MRKKLSSRLFFQSRCGSPLLEGGGKSRHLGSFSPFEGYFPIFFSLEMTLYSEGDMP